MENMPTQTDFDSPHQSDAETLDPLFDQCVQCVLDAGQASTSLLQRQLGLDYDRAARIMDELEDQGIIGPYEGPGPRKVLYSDRQSVTEPLETSSNEATATFQASNFASSVQESLEGKSKRNQTEFQQRLALNLRIALHTVVRWFFKPIPFLLYILCLGIIVFLVNDLYPNNPVLMLKNIVSTTLAFIFLRGIYESIRYLRNLIRQTKIKAKAQLDEVKKWNDAFPSARVSAAQQMPLSIDIMDGHQFEHFCADLLRQNGFINVEVTQASGDYGIDVLAEKEDVTYAIQCKCYSDNVGNHAVQEAHSGAAYYGRMVPVVMTNRYFTRAAKETAAQTHVVLWDRDKILQMMEK